MGTIFATIDGVVNRLDEIYAQLTLTKVCEQPIIQRGHDPRYPVHGHSNGRGVITINPIPSTLDTLIHELLHERHPEWSERTVKRETTRLIRSLSPSDMAALYEEYITCRCPKKRTKTVA